jgi:mRNA-degrading endonuclease YafQ of YafQ-DinJ toxin-antitoxin module
MEVELSPEFERQFRERANQRIRKLYRERLALFLKNPYDTSLRNHPLSHQWEGFRSFSLSADEGRDDYRVLFQRVGRDRYLFTHFGTHDQLYRPWR